MMSNSQEYLDLTSFVDNVIIDKPIVIILIIFIYNVYFKLILICPGIDVIWLFQQSNFVKLIRVSGIEVI
jgi:hypothetical protein